MSAASVVRGVLAAAALLLAACAHDQSAGGAGPIATPGRGDPRVAGIIERRRELALRYQQSGDLAAAANEWHIVTLLDPGDAAYRQQLASVQAAISRRTAELLESGQAALKRGDNDAATEAMLKALAVSPDNVEAARVLREIEKRRATRLQTDRVARLRPEDYGVTTARAVPSVPRAPDGSRAYDFDQSMELFRAGDTANGLAGFRRYVETNPSDKAGRQQIANAVFERGRELEAQGQGAQALRLYEQAIALNGATPTPWDTQMRALRKTLGADAYDKGLKVYRTDLPAAIRYWEAAVEYDPANTAAALKLREAKMIDERLRRLDPNAKR